MLIALVIAGIGFMKKVNDNGGGAAGLVSAVVGAEVNEEKLANMPKIYCVLLGQSQNLTDTIMLASYDPKNQEAAFSAPLNIFPYSLSNLRIIRKLL